MAKVIIHQEPQTRVMVTLQCVGDKDPLLNYREGLVKYVSQVMMLAQCLTFN